MNEIQRGFDYAALTADVRRFAQMRAGDIHEIARTTGKGVVLIGQALTEVKAKLPHGKWIPWLKSEFGWSASSAKAFMSVYRCSKSTNFGDLKIDVSALYLIAAPSIPEPVRSEVIARAERGDRITRENVQEVLDSYRDRDKNPPTRVACEIATATGQRILDSSGDWIPPNTTPERMERIENEIGEDGEVVEAIESLASADPVTIASRLDEFSYDGDLFANIEKAMQFLTVFKRTLRLNEKIQQTKTA